MCNQLQRIEKGTNFRCLNHVVHCFLACFGPKWSSMICFVQLKKALLGPKHLEVKKQCTTWFRRSNFTSLFYSMDAVMNLYSINFIRDPACLLVFHFLSVSCTACVRFVGCSKKPANLPHGRAQPIMYNQNTINWLLLASFTPSSITTQPVDSYRKLANNHNIVVVCAVV